MDTKLRATDRAGARPASYIAAVAAPLAVITVAYALSMASDRLLWIGPLDRAAFGWLVVVPLWLLAPAAAAIAMRHLGMRTSAAASIVIAVAVAIPAATLVWQSAAFPACPTGAIRTPEEMVAPATTVGAIVGIGLGAACFVAAELWRDGFPRIAVLAGATIHLVTSAVAFALGPLFIIGPLCQRPTI